jgi:hypothetical protein
MTDIPRLHAEADYEKLYAELRAHVRVMGDAPDAQSLRECPRLSTEHGLVLWELANILTAFANIYDLSNDDVLQAFSTFTYFVMLKYAPRDAAHSMILSALLNARDVYAPKKVKP